MVRVSVREWVRESKLKKKCKQKNMITFTTICRHGRASAQETKSV
jgi:hypothetical protein